MKITIELKSGKKLELTSEELQEIINMFGIKTFTSYTPIYQPLRPPERLNPYPLTMPPIIGTTCGATYAGHD